MAAWLARRSLAGLAILWAVATLTFVLIHAAPGDPFVPGGERPQDPAVTARLRAQFGLDRPLAEQYVRYLGQLARGNLGVSFSQRRPVAEALRDAVPHTLLLGAAALLVDFLVGLALGVLQAARAGSRTDTGLTALMLLVGSLPTFWLGLVVLLVFAEWLHWFPPGGAWDPVRHGALGLIGRTWDELRHLVLPAATLGLVGAGTTARYQRAAMLEALREPSVRAARARGLGEVRVLLRHALRNALLPAITLFGLALPFVLTGAVLVETVFGWPGMGRLAADAVLLRDYPLVMATTLVAAALVVAGNLAADALTAWLDPRTRRAATA